MTDSNSVPPLSGQLEFYMRPDCPFCDQVWTALAFKKLHYSKTDWTGVTEKPAWFKIASPQGTVPILRLLDGTYMDDSEDMLAWIDRQDTNEGSYGVTDEQDLKWLAVARKQLYPAMFRVLIPPSPAVQQEFTEKLIKVIETLTEHLKTDRGGPFFLGEGYTEIDIALTQLRRLRVIEHFRGVNFSNPTIDAYIAHLESSFPYKEILTPISQINAAFAPRIKL